MLHTKYCFVKKECHFKNIGRQTTTLIAFDTFQWVFGELNKKQSKGQYQRYWILQCL